MDGIDTVVVFVGGGAACHADGLRRRLAELCRQRADERAEQVQAQGVATFQQFANLRADDGHDQDRPLAVLGLRVGNAGQERAGLFQAVGEGQSELPERDPSEMRQQAQT